MTTSSTQAGRSRRETFPAAILGGLPAVAFPSSLGLEQQGLFALGYYHEAQALFDRDKSAERNSRFFPNQTTPQQGD